MKDHLVRRHPVIGVVALAVGLAGGSLALTVVHPDMVTAWSPSPWWTVLTVTLAFAAAEHMVFYVQYRREAIAYAMSELPTAIALLYLGVWQAVAAGA